MLDPLEDDPERRAAAAAFRLLMAADLVEHHALVFPADLE